MQVTVLGSCTVIQYPKDINNFFKGINLIDVRHGNRMEMDALPLLFLADMSADKTLRTRIINGLLENLKDSGGELWKCGMWGFDETHLRFTSVALRLMLLNQQEFDRKLVADCLSNHLSHSEKALGGTWFYHDSIETNKQIYYRAWEGKSFADASANNMLILNTHLDTLITLLLAKSKNVEITQTNEYIAEGFKALDTFFLHAQTIGGLKAKCEHIARHVMLKGLGKKDLWSRGSIYLLQRFYYRRVRYGQKHKYHIRAFTDGFLERDIRLTGPSLEYHVVNIWDMARLLLWISYTGVKQSQIESKLHSYIMQGLAYCFRSSAYRDYLQRVSKTKGVSNEILEAIAIIVVLGQQNTWLHELYLDWRTFAPPSVGILGIDKTISGEAINPKEFGETIPEHIDWIPFDNGQVFVANNGSTNYVFDAERYQLESVLSSGPKSASVNFVIGPKSLVVLKEVE